MQGSRIRLLMIAAAVVGSFAIVVETAQAAEDVAGADERWAADGQGGTAEFQRHVVPLLGKVGCNNRACHGSFQGQAGFRLSLFGHDPRMDHNELTKDEGEGPRVDTKSVDKSLALLKAVGEEGHEGGILMKEGSWQHRLFRSWIVGGAGFDPKKEAKLERLEVSPKEVRLNLDNMQQQTPLRTVAYFSDGTAEDVTCLTNFSTNDESVVEVTEDGRISATGSGDTAVVATFGGAVVTTQAVVPVKDDGKPFPEFPANNEVDRLVLAKLKKVGIRPSELSSDEVFLRRLFLDVIGTLPTSDEVRKFLADKSPDKRSKLIDQLLERPEYGMYWATKFSDWTGNDNRFTPQPRAKTGWLWHDWLRDKLVRNVPYDEIVGGFLVATTREGRPLDDVIADYKTIEKNLVKGFDDGTYARRKTNDIFWLKAGNSRPETAGMQAAYAFLGVRLACARCHKHPFDRWTQEDFNGFMAFFSAVDRVVPKDVPKAITKKKSQSSFVYREVVAKPSAKYLRSLKRSPPKLLAGKRVPYEEGKDVREALWEWMRSPENPYLSRAIVNRFWGHYLGVGIVNPIDDFNAANPPSNPQLLDWLAKDFIDHKFDLKHLHRQILNSRTYQLSWVPNDSNRLDERNFSHALLRRMPAEVVLGSINQITGGQDRYSSSNAPAGTRAINLALTRLRGGGPEYVLGIFGRPLRTQQCDCERSSETGLAQAMYLLNDTDVNGKIGAAKGRLAKLIKEFSDDRKLIEELYLITLSRFPSDDEMRRTLE
ncbi:MAG: DUF1553 domain-containing protein [Planctomycetaceae bacterium]|nr:DUF1553 domain-containing protein [Planctomycetaceae bacterium]